MVNVTYQVIFDNNTDLIAELNAVLKEAFDDNYVTYEDEDFNLIEIKYTIKIDNDKSVSGFQVSFDSLDEEVIKIVESFNEKLKENEKLAVAFKFHDDTLFESLKKLYEELFEMEMRLREVVSLIFIDTYKDDFYNLLYEVDIPVQTGLNKQWHKNKEQRKQFLSKHLENEFFHILFSDYVKLTNPRTLKQQDLFLIAEMSTNFDDFRDGILNRGIAKEEYLEFINSIKENMNILEKVRNCFAHNRTPSGDDIYNYTISKEAIENKISEFLESLSTEENGD